MRKLATIISFIGFTLFAIGLLIWPFFLHASVPGKKEHANGIGFVQYQENPNSYIAGAVVDIFDIEERKGLVIRVQPEATYSLFTEDILFCNSPVQMLVGKHNPMVLTYSKVAHRTIEGLGCHDLVSVDEMKPKELPQ